MKRGTLQHLLHLNTHIINSKILSNKLQTKLKATITTLHQQRAAALATSEAKVTKANRPVRDLSPDSFTPVDLHVDTYKVRIGANQFVDDFADRLAACWNACLGVPTQDLLPGHYSSLRAREPA